MMNNYKLKQISKIKGIKQEGFDFSDYIVSEDGYVYSNKTKKKLKQFQTQKGYLRVTLYDKGSRLTFYVHRLVALAFIEDADAGLEVNHKDFNKHNNKLSNLELVDRAENMQHYHYHKKLLKMLEVC